MHGQGDDEDERVPKFYRGETTLDKSPLYNRDPRTFKNKADKWGDRVFLATPADALAAGAGIKSRSNLVDTREFEVARAMALYFRFQAVNSPFPLAGPFSPLAANWFPTPTFNVRVRVRLSLGPEGGVSETLYTNNVGVPTVDLILPRIVLCTKLSVDVECVGGFGEAGTNSGYVECWSAPIDAVQPTSLIDNRAGDLTGNFTASIFRIAVNAGAAQTFFLSDVRRRQFIVQNNSTQRLALALGPVDPQFTAGAERWSIIVAPGAIYESPIGGFAGEIRGIWEAADATGEALVTDVRVP